MKEDIHNGIHDTQTDEHRKDICYQRIALQRRTEEGQKGKQGKRDTSEQQERTELTPTRIRTVSPNTYYRIHHRIHDGT